MRFFLTTSVFVLAVSTLLATSVMATNKPSELTVGKVEKIDGHKLRVGLTDVITDLKTKIVGQKIRLNSKVAVVSNIASGSGEAKKAVKVYVKDGTASGKLKRRAVQGVITGISGDVITLSHQIKRDREFKVLTDAQTVVKSKKTASESAALTVGLRIVAVGTPTEGGILAKLIHIIPGKAKGVFKTPTP